MDSTTTTFFCDNHVFVCADSRKALSQRESELLDTSDQCRAMLEEQIADLKKTCATLEHQLTTAREDGKALQTTLNEKVCCTYIYVHCIVLVT